MIKHLDFVSALLFLFVAGAAVARKDWMVAALAILCVISHLRLWALLNE